MLRRGEVHFLSLYMREWQDIQHDWQTTLDLSLADLLRTHSTTAQRAWMLLIVCMTIQMLLYKFIATLC